MSLSFSFLVTPEFVRLNRARVNEKMDPLPDDDTLTLSLIRAGFTTCEGRKYVVPEVEA